MTVKEEDEKLFLACLKCSVWVESFLELKEDAKKSLLLAETQKQVKLSISIVNEALDTYNLNDIAISFNGGKDCLVMLVIFIATLYKRIVAGKTQLPEGYRELQAVYVHSTNTFVSVDDFVDRCNDLYALKTTKFPFPLKEAFGKYLAQEPNVKAILVGIRRADPYGQSLSYIQRTDHGWPDFVRIHPVLEWHYVEIWEFLRTLSIPYCHLYDEGYTSLGGTNNTIQNPMLANQDGTFKPAYELECDDNERLGRT